MKYFVCIERSKNIHHDHFFYLCAAQGLAISLPVLFDTSQGALQVVLSCYFDQDAKDAIRMIRMKSWKSFIFLIALL